MPYIKDLSGNNNTVQVGGPYIESPAYNSDVSLGRVAGSRVVTALGNNPSIDTGSVPEDVVANGGLYAWMTAATSLEIVSDSANDTAAGTGMRTVTVEGLTRDFIEINQTVTLNGLTPVVLPIPIYRINNFVIASAGSVGTNVGTITIRDAGGGTVRDIIPAGFGRNRSSNFTVPAGKTLLLGSFAIAINRPTTQRDATITSMVRLPNGAFTLNNEVSVDGNPVVRNLYPNPPIGAGYDFIFRCTYASANATDLTASWIGMLIQND